VIIIDSASIVQARMDAAADGTDEERASRWSSPNATLVPDTAIGRMLNVSEAEKLLQSIERQTNAPS